VIRSAHSQVLDRAAAAFVFALLVIGTLVLWIGIPVAGMWVLSRVTESRSGHFVAALIGLPLAMILWTPALFGLNRLYLRIRAAGRPNVAHDGGDDEWDLDPDDPQPSMRGPLEPLLVISLAISIVALLVWFLLIAENPNTAAF
jgi:hypothetical protein